MLMHANTLKVTQLLTDLMEVRDRLCRGWVQGAFVRDDNVCIVAAVNEVTGGDNVTSFTSVPATNATPEQERAARVLCQLHDSLYGPSTGLTVVGAAQRIASFNDSKQVTKEAVLLLFDRAIADLMAPPTDAAQ
jgi:nitrite reductase/ring-hydroxylating ferredoxin subunit